MFFYASFVETMIVKFILSTFMNESHWTGGTFVHHSFLSSFTQPKLIFFCRTQKKIFCLYKVNRVHCFTVLSPTFFYLFEYVVHFMVCWVYIYICLSLNTQISTYRLNGEHADGSCLFVAIPPFLFNIKVLW